MKSKKNYKGVLCRTCLIPITIGSRSGFCRKHRVARKLSQAEKKTISLRMSGSNNHRFGVRISDETRRLLSVALMGNTQCKGRTPWNKGKKFEQISGERHWAWRGGITSIAKSVRSSLEYKKWREVIFKRDNYTCVWCGVRGVYLQADHIKPFSLFPELRLEIGNGRTLCVPCHRKTDTFAGRIFSYAVE